MTIVLGLSPTNMAFADKLDQLLLRGTLSDIQEELHRPTSSVADCARLSKRCTTSALSILDSSTSYGTLVVGCAALARRSFAFRLACFSMILERGANPFARGTDGRAVSWILDGIKNSAERQCFEEELQAAQKAWKSGEKYEMGAFSPRQSLRAFAETRLTALDIREWIEDSLAVMEEEKREAFKQSKREAFVQSPQEIEPAVAERGMPLHFVDRTRGLTAFKLQHRLRLLRLASALASSLLRPKNSLLRRTSRFPTTTRSLRDPRLSWLSQSCLRPNRRP